MATNKDIIAKLQCVEDNPNCRHGDRCDCVDCDCSSVRSDENMCKCCDPRKEGGHVNVSSRQFD